MENNDLPKLETLGTYLRDKYREIVKSKHPNDYSRWPVISGSEISEGFYNDIGIVVYKHVGPQALFMFHSMPNLTESFIGEKEINKLNKERVRAKLEKHFGVRGNDGLLIVSKNDNDTEVHSELNIMLAKHEQFMGLASMKIFLSHKGSDKQLVREYKKILLDLGFDPWLDEDAMPAGTSLERGIFQGFEESCAAIFFITPNYIDEGYLSTEIEYAISQKRQKGNQFAIITLVFTENGKTGQVPVLLRSYVWKEPINDLESLREILKALPIEVGPYRLK